MSHIWPGESFHLIPNPLTQLYMSLTAALLCDMKICFKFVLDMFFPRAGINHFSKELWFLRVGNDSQKSNPRPLDCSLLLGWSLFLRLFSGQNHRFYLILFLLCLYLLSPTLNIPVVNDTYIITLSHYCILYIQYLRIIQALYVQCNY